jgi:hypothetical protein
MTDKARFQVVADQQAASNPAAATGVATGAPTPGGEVLHPTHCSAHAGDAAPLPACDRPMGNPAATRPADFFDLDRFRLPQNFEATVGVKKLIVAVPVKKPDRQAFIRVHPDEDWRLATAVIELKEDREIYLVDPTIAAELPQEVLHKILFAAVTRQNDAFVWPVNLDRDDRRGNDWNRSALAAAQVAMSRWVRISSNMSIGAYDVVQAADTIPDPTWPDIGFQGLLKIAFQDRIIESLDHPVVCKLRGGSR